jgi:hypothetical protein
LFVVAHDFQLPPSHTAGSDLRPIPTALCNPQVKISKDNMEALIKALTSYTANALKEFLTRLGLNPMSKPYYVRAVAYQCPSISLRLWCQLSCYLG